MNKISLGDPFAVSKPILVRDVLAQFREHDFPFKVSS